MGANKSEDGPTACQLQLGLQLADTLLRQGQVALAIEHYRWVAANCARRGEYRNALGVYTLLAGLIPHCLHTQGMMADLHRRIGRPVEAAAIFERIAHSHIQLGRYDDAAAVLKLVTEIDPATVPRRVQLAELLLFLGRTEDAVAEFNVAARQLYAGARTHEYIWVAERLLSQAPEHVGTLRDIVRVYLHCGHHAYANLYLNRLLLLRPGDDHGREILAESFAGRGRHDRACRVAALLGSELRGRGVHAFDEAKRLFRRAIAWYPYDAVAQKQLLDLEAEMAELAKKDFADDRTTGVIGFVSDDELLKRPQPEEAVTNVLNYGKNPLPPPPEAEAEESGQVIFANFAG